MNHPILSNNQRLDTNLCVDNNQSSGSKLYSVSEVADILSVRPRTVRRWYRKGELKIIRLPSGKVRIAKCEVDKILGVEI